jgi:hypothetical protein
MVLDDYTAKRELAVEKYTDRLSNFSWKYGPDLWISHVCRQLLATKTAATQKPLDPGTGSTPYTCCHDKKR